MTPTIDIFKNPKPRLNKRGVSLMRKHFNSWTVDGLNLNGNNLISLMRKMDYPYYVDKKVLNCSQKGMSLWQN